MSAILHFCSGKSLPITQKEFEQIAPKLQQGGIRLYRTGSKSLVPLNSNTIELIEYVDDVPVERPAPQAEPELPAEIAPEAEIKTIDPEPIGEPKEDPMEKMIRLSNCKHEPEILELYRQHTAKGIRYFPVCTVCGKRERYISESKVVKGEYEGTPNAKWTSDDIANAKEWIEK
jgi:hypothetical protein